VTLRRCEFGEQLPPDVSCAALCPEFPACLPAPSPELLRDLGRFISGAEQQHANAEAVAYTLSSLHRAITEGLARKEEL
jgi:hypothetical protein